MSDLIVKKLKKYFLFLSLLFFFSLGIHLTYSYVYSDSLSEPEQWGTISEAIIGTFPHLNPLIPSNDHNAYINGLLYRSLLEYSTISGTLESDIASCNIENLLYIECVIESNLKWSDGTPITVSDIEATFNVISQTKVNPIIASLLENTTIETTENTISFENTSKDVNFLQIFLQPILPKTIVEWLTTETVEQKFSEIDGIYSGRFTLTNISKDDTVWITKITFWKNDMYFWNELFIKFLILNLYTDENHFLKNKSSFNIFNDKERLIGNSIPRLTAYEYTLSQFVASFLNTEQVSEKLRPHILNALNRDDIIEAVWENNVIAAENPFLSEEDFENPKPAVEIQDFMKEKWYYSKKELLKSASETEAKIIADVEKELKAKEKAAEEEAKEVIVPEEKKILPTQSDLKVIVSPTTKKYNFTSEENILVEWEVSQWVSAVFINDYKLEWFDAWDSKFFYRLLKSFDSIKEWENNYKVYYETDGEKKLVDEFSYYYNTDADALQKYKDSFFETAVENNGWDIEESSDTEKADDGNEDNEKAAEVAWVQTELSSKEIEALDENLYYNEAWKSYSINIVYAQTDDEMQLTAAEIQSQLFAAWINSQLMPMTLWDITVGLRNETLEYDMIVIWVNLWYFGSNIFPYFHSSQVANGYNFSNYKKLSVDILLEELKSNTLAISKQEELELKLLDIIKEDSVVKVLYTPKIRLLVDKNIKNFELPAYLPDSRHRYFPLVAAYLSEKREIQTWDKWPIGFVWYIIRTLFSY